MEGDKCWQCAFTAELNRDTGTNLCLVDGQVYQNDHPCHMPTSEERWKNCNDTSIVRAFQKNTDMVRAALKLIMDYKMDNEAAKDMASVIKIIHGRDK